MPYYLSDKLFKNSDDHDHNLRVNHRFVIIIAVKP